VTYRFEGNPPTIEVSVASLSGSTPLVIVRWTFAVSAVSTTSGPPTGSSAAMIPHAAILYVTVHLNDFGVAHERVGQPLRFWRRR
jgi:hypothetical protein